MDKLCIRCSVLQNVLKGCKWQDKMSCNRPSVFIMSYFHRSYATSDRSAQHKYRHGKLIEKVEDQHRYPKTLLTLTGTDEAVLDQFFHFVKKAARMADVTVSKSFSMPAEHENYVARREGKEVKTQIEYNFKRFQRIIEVLDLTPDKSDIFLEFAQQSLPAGVDVKIEAQRWEMLVDPNHVTLRDEI